MGRKRKHHESSSIGFDILRSHKFCDDDFLIRLAGIEGGLSFRLKQMMGKCIKLSLLEPANELVSGEVSMVGSNFVELCSCRTDNDPFPKKETIKIIPLENINKIWFEGECHRNKCHREFRHHKGCLCKICKTHSRVIKH
ncbi:hypothetical protein [Peribacillus deserti]|uniref:Uncharacterized protein n=1 Tax=Peribacillus deserti TaxID=673318 RepID=A0A2N5M2G1_9BACI|nr:hypothetical protein [Peribacillus deserti]PLT28549.1 hypothetical protein CUU66_17855 [Peribacillus deserti]